MQSQDKHSTQMIVSLGRPQVESEVFRPRSFRPPSCSGKLHHILYTNALTGFKLSYSLCHEIEVGEEVEESKWQDRIAYRFDQIVSFASTAMEDKRRRSTEEGTSCNTSPDSGIGHGDPPPPSLTIVSQKRLSDSMARMSPPKQPRTFKTPIVKSSPNLDAPSIEAPSTRTRTPSPCSLSLCSPPVPTPPPLPTQPPLPPPSPKYQRQEKSPSQTQHHFKKKFFHREHWNGWQNESGRHHKGKFKPKGKDWNWNGQEQDQEGEESGEGGEAGEGSDGSSWSHRPAWEQRPPM